MKSGHESNRLPEKGGQIKTMSESIDLDAVEKKIQEEFLRAKDALQTLRKYFNNNGNGSENGSSSRIPPIAMTRAPEIVPAVNADFADAEDGETQSIIDKVEEVMRADPSKKWTVPSMVAYLKYIHFPLAAKKPAATMGLVFAKLAYKRETIRMVKKGSGRNPNWFKGNPIQVEAMPTTEDSQNEQAAS
jgi:hypothetical protein